MRPENKENLRMFLMELRVVSVGERNFSGWILLTLSSARVYFCLGTFRPVLKAFSMPCSLSCLAHSSACLSLPRWRRELRSASV